MDSDSDDSVVVVAIKKARPNTPPPPPPPTPPQRRKVANKVTPKGKKMAYDGLKQRSLLDFITVKNRAPSVPSGLPQQPITHFFKAKAAPIVPPPTIAVPTTPTVVPIPLTSSVPPPPLTPTQIVDALPPNDDDEMDMEPSVPIQTHANPGRDNRQSDAEDEEMWPGPSRRLTRPWAQRPTAVMSTPATPLYEDTDEDEESTDVDSVPQMASLPDSPAPLDDDDLEGQAADEEQVYDDIFMDPMLQGMLFSLYQPQQATNLDNEDAPKPGPSRFCTSAWIQRKDGGVPTPTVDTIVAQIVTTQDTNAMFADVDSDEDTMDVASTAPDVIPPLLSIDCSSVPSSDEIDETVDTIQPGTSISPPIGQSVKLGVPVLIQRKHAGLVQVLKDALGLGKDDLLERAHFHEMLKMGPSMKIPIPVPIDDPECFLAMHQKKNEPKCLCRQKIYLNLNSRGKVQVTNHWICAGCLNSPSKRGTWWEGLPICKSCQDDDQVKVKGPDLELLTLGEVKSLIRPTERRHPSSVNPFVEYMQRYNIGGMPEIMGEETDGKTRGKNCKDVKDVIQNILQRRVKKADFVSAYKEVVNSDRELDEILPNGYGITKRARNACPRRRLDLDVETLQVHPLHQTSVRFDHVCAGCFRDSPFCHISPYDLLPFCGQCGPHEIHITMETKMDCENGNTDRRVHTVTRRHHSSVEALLATKIGNLNLVPRFKNVRLSKILAIHQTCEEALHMNCSTQCAYFVARFAEVKTETQVYDNREISLLNHGDLGVFFQILKDEGIILGIEDGIEDVSDWTRTWRSITKAEDARKGENLIYIKKYLYDGMAAVNIGENHGAVNTLHNVNGERKACWFYEQATIQDAKERNLPTPVYNGSHKKFIYAAPASESLDIEALLTLAALIAWMFEIPDPLFDPPQVAHVINRKINWVKFLPDSTQRLKAFFFERYGRRPVIGRKR